MLIECEGSKFSCSLSLGFLVTRVRVRNYVSGETEK